MTETVLICVTQLGTIALIVMSYFLGQRNSPLDRMLQDRKEELCGLTFTRDKDCQWVVTVSGYKPFSGDPISCKFRIPPKGEY